MVRIIITLLGFWFFNAMHWWAVFEFGIYATSGFMVYSIIVFSCTVIFGFGMLISGSQSNKIKRHYEFLKEQITEFKAQKAEERERVKQEEAYKKKIEASGVSGVIASGDLKSGLKKSSGVTAVKARDTNLAPKLIDDGTR